MATATQSPTGNPAKRTRKKPVVDVTSTPIPEPVIPLYDKIPSISVVPITDNTLYIIMALIQTREFTVNRDDFADLIKSIYTYSISRDRNGAVLVINKDRKTAIITFLDQGTISDYSIAESDWIEALEHPSILMYKISSIDNKTAMINNITHGNILFIPNRTFSENRYVTIKFTEELPVTASASGKRINWVSPVDTFTIVRRKRSQEYFAIHSLFFTDYSYPLVGINIATGAYWRLNSNDLENIEVIQHLSDLTHTPIEFVTKIEQKYSKAYFREQIRTRYFMPSPTRNNNKNIVVDSYLPSRFYHQNVDNNSFGNPYSIGFSYSDERHYAVSRLAADVLNATPISIENMCKAVGFTLKKIKDLLTQVKGRNILPVFVGVGGTGMNTLYWLNELCAYANVFDIFRNGINIYEPEKIEVSNMLRFPMPLSVYAKPSQGSPFKTSLMSILTSNLTRSLNTSITYMDDKVLRNYMTSSGKVAENVVFYGAPDIKSRELLSPTGRFIAATHANNSCSIWINPIQNSDIQVESYGLIQLNTFFMNQFRMAIAFLELLVREDINKLPSDTRAFSYSFNGVPESPLDRNYYWYISQDLQMTPES